MTLMFKLIWRDLRANPGRMAVSVFAILVSVSLIVWMMGSYDTLVREFDNDAEAYMGNYDLCLVPESPKGPLPPGQYPQFRLSLIHISEPTRRSESRMPSSA